MIKERNLKRLVSLLMAFFLVFGLIPLGGISIQNAKAATTHVVISAVYGAGGGTGALYKNDFVELYNPTDSDVDLSGYSIQYQSATTAAGTAFSGVLNLEKGIKSHGFYLIQLAPGSGAGQDLPTPDASSTINMSGTAGKIALVSSQSPITIDSNHVTSPSTVKNVVDFVGFGTANISETNPTAVLGTATYARRRADPIIGGGYGLDTDNNSNDFASESKIAPRNSSSPVEPSAGSTPPSVTHTPVTSADVNTPIDISAVVGEKDSVTAAVYYGYTADGTTFTNYVNVTNSVYGASGYTCTVSIPGQSKDFYYYIKAVNKANLFRTNPLDIKASYKVTINDTIPPSVISASPLDGAKDVAPNIPIKVTFDKEIIASGKVNMSDGAGNPVDGVSIAESGNTLFINHPTLANETKYSVNIPAGVVSSAKGVAYTSPINFSFTTGKKATYNIYFGQLHSHTTNSDGVGTLDDAYTYAKNTSKLDFFAVTDHSNSFDNGKDSNILDGSKSTKWIAGLTAADKYTDSSFTGIYAYEMTWSNGTGHMNTFNTSGFETRDNSIYSATNGLQSYYTALKTSPAAIAQFNHPGSTFGDFKDFASYDEQVDSIISLLEVGNGEGPIGSSGYFPSYNYYTRALDKGWHVAPTNNQDNHKGLWGDANTARSVVLAESLTRDSIYDAMRNMRVYATEDKNLRINYTLNGEVMGTKLSDKQTEVKIKVDLEDPDNEVLGKVSVIVNGGKVAASKTLNTSKDSVEFTLSPDYSYYYIRVDEADKDIAVTAPVWVGEVDKAGIAKTSGSTTLPIKGEKLTITSEFYNNEAKEMKIKTLEYSIDGTVINSAPAQSAVASLSTSSYSFDYTPSKAGSINVNVKLTTDINGVEKIFTDVLKLKVGHPVLISKVVIDGSHFNDYVNGYNANNVNNITTLANGENIKIVVEKNALTDDVLAGTQLLILSSPAKKTGTANGVNYVAKNYTNEELDAIKRYAAAGGNIIVNALADYQDSKTDTVTHSAYQQNKVLEAIGVGTRINDDEVVDYDNNPNVSPKGVAGGTPYRVPMNVYNENSPYLKGVEMNLMKDPEKKAQDYSFYSGCSITMGANAIWLVKGTPTTYGFDSDKDGLGGSYVAAANKTIPSPVGSIGKGNVVALAEETLSGGGKVFVGGTAFYSDYEIKASLDNYTQLQNSNYNITMNILDSVKKIIPITAIKTIRAAQIGDVFCAEGYVTAGTHIDDNKFFDTIYIQDSTGGINIFPVSGMDIMLGQKVKVTGEVQQYNGDTEIKVMDISVTDTAQNIVEPKAFTTGKSMLEENQGWLIKIQGKVTKMTVDTIYVDDGSGEARVFVDGYIGDGTSNNLGKWDSSIKVGDSISAIGLASTDTEGKRLRVRNTAEIVKLPSGGSNGSGYIKPAPEILNDVNGVPYVKAAIELNKETGIAKGTIDLNLINKAIEALKSDEKGIKTIKLEVPKVDGAKAYVQQLPKEALNEEKASHELVISTEFASMALQGDTLKNAKIEDGQIGLMVKSAIADGNRPAIEWSLTAGDKEIELQNNNAPVKFTIPYKPSSEEEKEYEHIIVTTLDKNGRQQIITDGKYDSSTGNVTFTSANSGKFSIAFIQKSFEDIQNYAWAKNEIEVMASKGIINGVSEKEYKPESNITRGDFIKLLVRALNLKAEVKAGFDDVSTADYYYNEIGIAKELGLVKGAEGNQFKPKEELTRQDMMVLAARAMQLSNKASLNDLSKDVLKFEDRSEIAEYAVQEAALMVKEGLVKGDGNKINPLANLNRAEAAAIIYRLYNK